MGFKPLAMIGGLLALISALGAAYYVIDRRGYNRGYAACAASVEEDKQRVETVLEQQREELRVREQERTQAVQERDRILQEALSNDQITTPVDCRPADHELRRAADTFDALRGAASR